jgi:UrcA family protein
MPIFTPPLCRWSPPFVHRSMPAARSEGVPAPDEAIGWPVEGGAHAEVKRVIFPLPLITAPKGRMKMQGRTAPTVIAALLSAMAFCQATPASAQEPPLVVYGEAINAQTERVAFADLDLASARGQARLHNRVGGAIERVCDLDVGRQGLQDRDYYRCADSAWGAAAPQIAEAVATGNTALGAAIVVSGR